MNDPDRSVEDDLPLDEVDVETLANELQAARDEAASHLDDLRRVAADFDNYRKRVTKESESTLDRATERVVMGLLPALDTFDAALTTTATTETEKLLYSGMLNTREQLLKALGAEGLEMIQAVGEPFDPEVHEPIGAPEGGGRLVVADELRRGYRLRNKVLRAALVTLEAEEE